MSRRSRQRRQKNHPHFLAAVGGSVAVVLVVVVAILLIAVVGVVGVARSWLAGLPNLDDKNAFALAQTTRIYSADGVLLANLYLENRSVVPLDKISKNLQNAVVAVEDLRFYEHNGVDFPGMIRAVITNITTGRREGASTITQQYIRNTILAKERFQISYRRKLREAVLAMEFEKRHSKAEILAMYLNTVYYGEGAYGAEAASLTYFNKHASDLTLAESALIAGLPQAPGRLSPYTNPDGAVARRNWVLSKMFEQGKITRADYEAAKVEPLNLKRSPELDEHGIYAAPYFVAHVKKALQDKYGTSLVFGGGLTVYTTLDTRLQTDAENAVNGILNKPSDPDCALVAIDPHNGYIKALVGGRNWNENKFNFATQALRQPGSSFKVFTLVTALEEGMPPRRMLDSSSPATIPNGTRPWIVGNAEGGGRGYITLQQATVGSVNTAFARLIKEIGPEKVVRVAKRMGIESTIKPYLSLTLGSQQVTPLEMASAFGTLANDGKHYPHTAITKIIDANGKTIFQADPQGTQALDPKIAYAATSILKGVITSGTGRGANIGRPAAGKTGTTQDYRDAWFVGYTPQLSCAVWMGYTPERPMRNVHGRRVFGGTFSAPIWRAFMSKALAGQATLDFTHEPSPTYTWKPSWGVPSKAVPLVLGQTQAMALKNLSAAGFTNITVGAAFSDTVAAGLVGAQTPAAGAKVDPSKAVVVIVVSKGPDPNKVKPPVTPPVTPPTTATPTP